ncbi:MAG: sugar phosphorylase, partial [Caldilineales bacterium]|nr:sugar phosphorylase [Caldilineales bacterium]
PDPHDVSRFLASQAILLSLAGVPGIYIHSLFGSRNCHECVAETGRARSINRQKFLLPEIEQSLARPDAHQRQVLNGYLHLLRQRGGHPAFHPAADQRILDLNPSVLGLVRGVADADPFDNLIVVLINVSDQTQSLSLDLQNLDLPLSSWWHDLVGKGRYLAAADALSFDLDPYQIVWLTPRD